MKNKFELTLNWTESYSTKICVEANSIEEAIKTANENIDEYVADSIENKGSEAFCYIKDKEVQEPQ